MTQRYKFLAGLKVLLLISLPIVLLALPASFFDDRESICLSVLLFDLECYACGMTRSIMHLIHFNFLEAFYYNPLGFVVLPVLAWIWWSWLKKNYKRVRVTE